MAASVTTGGITQGTVDQAGKTVLVNLQATYAGFFTSGNVHNAIREGFQFGVGSLTTTGPQEAISGLYGFLVVDISSGSYSYTPGQTYTTFVVQAQFTADKTCYYRGRGEYWYDPDGSGLVYDWVYFGGITSFLSYAIDATSSNPTSSAVTSVTATIACLYFPNTNESAASVKLQYKRHVDPTWIDAGAADNVSGYSQLSISRNLSGLVAATQYDVRLTMTRTTANSTTLTSATSNFTTLAGQPTITTKAATVISVAGTTLNGTVNPNGASTTYWFDWGTTTGYGTSTAAQGPSSSSSPIDYNAVTTALAANTLYHFRAHALQGGTDYFGTDLTFTTDLQGHIMPTVYQNFAKYGAQTDFFFCVEVPGSTNSDRFFSGAVPWGAGDVLIDKDGGGLVNVTNLPVRIGSTPLYKITVTAAELSANKVSILLIDLTATPVWRDCHIAIETRLLLGQLDVDASGIGGNTHAMSLVGVGTGYGLFTKGSSGVGAFAQGTSGHGIMAQGIGAGFGLAGGSQAGSAALITNLFEQLEGPEPAGAPGNNESIKRILQYAKRRDVNRVTQDSSKQIWYRDNSTDLLCQRTVSDDLVTQVQNKLF